MDPEDMQRRMVRLKKYRTTKGKPEDYLELVLDNALDTFYEITHRTTDPGARIDGLICELANHFSNMEGAEHTQTAKEGELERVWQGLPDELYKRMLNYRLVVGVNAEHDV